MTADEFFTWLLVGLMAAIVGGTIALAIKGIFFNKLPPWVGLTGQSYLDWKNGKESKPPSDE